MCIIEHTRNALESVVQLGLADYAYLENRGCNYVYLQCIYNTGVITDTTVSNAYRSKMYDGTLV